jgi:hypothetical protein
LVGSLAEQGCANVPQWLDDGRYRPKQGPALRQSGGGKREGRIDWKKVDCCPSRAQGWAFETVERGVRSRGHAISSGKEAADITDSVDQMAR